MHEEIHELLTALKLRGINEKLDIILAETAEKSLSTAQVLTQLLREEYLYRRERSILYRLGKSKIPWNWSIDTFPFEQQPSINKLQIKNLADLSFIERRENIVLIGEPGVGKSGIAISLLREAVVNGYNGCFFDAQNLLNELYSALADNHSTRLLRKLSSYDILVIDELGYLILKPEQINAFFKLIEMRYNRKSTIITTNLNYPEWYDVFKSKSLVDALLDRLRHHCCTIHIQGKSLRESDES